MGITTGSGRTAVWLALPHTFLGGFISLVLFGPWLSTAREQD